MITNPTLPLPPNPVGASPALKRLLWVYLGLLIFEGALRKWFLPQFSAPLLIIRDPLVILIYLMTSHQRLVSRDTPARALRLLIASSVFLFLVQFILLDVPGTVLIYGMRTNFLHLPLIFLIPLILTLKDILRMGKWMLVISIPMMLLMSYQFESAPDAWINKSPGTGAGQQLSSSLGRIRPPGTFSFITGPVSFFAVVTAFLLNALKPGREGYSRWLLIGGSISVAMAIAISGSRSLVIAVILVLTAWLIGVVAAKQAEAGISRLLILIVLTLAVLVEVELFKEGTEVLSSRWQMAAEVERSEGGIIGRIGRSLLSPLSSIGHAPLFGHGLGVGTNAGAALMTGKAQFLLAEEEWGRLVLEMGPVLGIAFILFRICLTVWLARLSVRCATQGKILPLLLFSASAAHILCGQIAQPTTLGFTVIVGGFCLASIKESSAPATEPETQTAHPQDRAPRPIPLDLQNNGPAPAKS